MEELSAEEPDDKILCFMLGCLVKNVSPDLLYFSHTAPYVEYMGCWPLSHGALMAHWDSVY